MTVYIFGKKRGKKGKNDEEKMQQGTVRVDQFSFPKNTFE